MLKPLWTFAALVAASLCWTPVGLAQEPPKDDGLDKLLEKLEKPKPTAEKKQDEEPVKPKDEVGAKDKDLDSLLEKLGESEEKPAARGKPQPKTGPDEGNSPAPPKPGAPGSGSGRLTGQSQALDEHLEELTGRKKKNKQQAQQQKKDSQNGGPLTEAIKKMDEVEQRLSKTDTGAMTRKAQDEIVKKLDSILEQLRQSSAQGQGKKMTRRIQQAGAKPGDTPGQEPGNTGTGVGPSKPLRPTAKSALANSKDTWGDLPPHLREEMDNVFKAEMLPAKRLLIEQYYLSLAKKSRAREE